MTGASRCESGMTACVVPTVVLTMLPKVGRSVEAIARFVVPKLAAARQSEVIISLGDGPGLSACGSCGRHTIDAHLVWA